VYHSNPSPSSNTFKPRLHDTTCCQTGLTTGECLYTRYNWLSNRFDNQLYHVNGVLAIATSVLWDFSNVRLYHVHHMLAFDRKKRASKGGCWH